MDLSESRFALYRIARAVCTNKKQLARGFLDVLLSLPREIDVQCLPYLQGTVDRALTAHITWFDGCIAVNICMASQ